MRNSSFPAVVFTITGLLSALGTASAQSAPNVSQVLVYSGVYNANSTTQVKNAPALQLNNAVLSLYSGANALKGLSPAEANALVGQLVASGVGPPAAFGTAVAATDLSQALNANIATALSIIPIASPASGVILKQDSATGAAVPANSTLGPVFTERAETIGKGKFYVGITSQSFQFGSINGKSLNGLTMLYKAGTDLSRPGGPSAYSASYDVGASVRLSQTTAFLSYGVTNRFDISVGLPMVHAAIAARTYNAQSYMGTGNGLGGSSCWCAGTFFPGAAQSYLQDVGQANASSTGFGDMLIRFKGIAKETGRGVLAVGTDLRLPTGDEKNYHGIGTTAVKPFAAFSWFAQPVANKIVIAPHAYVGWQFTGKSYLGGNLVPGSATVNGVNYLTAPFTVTKNEYLPDVFSWTIGTEVAFGPRHTFIFDLLGNQIGLIHGVPSLVEATGVQGPGAFTGNYDPNASTASINSPRALSGLVKGANSSFGQYNGSFGYKAKLVGNLVLTLNALVRFDSNGLTARFVPLYGLGYSFK